MKIILKKTYSLQLAVLLFIIFLFSPILLSINETNLILLRNSQLKLLCHQELERFIDFYGYHTLVCSRCLGLYCGFFIMSFFKLESDSNLFYLAIIPTIVDKVLEVYIPINNDIRFISGVFLAYFFYRLIFKFKIKAKLV
jgi:uncharacterized membrane protein